MASRRPPRHKSLGRTLNPWETVGSRIRDYREQAGMDQTELACEVEISTPFLSKIECGRRRAQPELIAAIVRAFRSDAAATPVRITPEDLTRHAGYPGIEVELEGTTARASISSDGLSPELRALVRRDNA